MGGVGNVSVLLNTHLHVERHSEPNFMRMADMKKLALAALLALPLSAALPQKADAFCFGLKGGFNIKICATGCLVPYCSSGCDTGCGYGGGCPGNIPGPWYLYWPADGGGMQQCANGYGYGGGNWTLDRHFATAAPTGYPYYPSPMYMSQHQAPAPTAYPYWPSQAAGFGANYGYRAPQAPVFQPVSYYPSYWYGR